MVKLAVLQEEEGQAEEVVAVEVADEDDIDAVQVLLQHLEVRERDG